jgi:gliding motility-associated-like protein
VRDAAGCTQSSSYVVAASPAVVQTLLAQNDATCASGGELSVAAAAGTPPYAFALDGGAPQSIGTFTGLAAGTYSLLVSDDAGCTAAATYTINAPALPDAPEVSVSGDCATQQIAVLTTGALAYRLNGGPWQPETLFAGLTPGTYVVELAFPGSCFVDTTLVLTPPPAVGQALVALTPVNCDSEGTLEVTGVAGTPPYSFQLSGSTGWQPGGSFDGLPAGSYSVTVRDALGCTATALYVVEAPPPLQLALDSVGTIDCWHTVGFAALSASGGSAPYAFELGQGGPQPGGYFDGLAAGQYTVVATDAEGCTAAFGFTVTGQPTDTVFTYETAVIYEGGTYGLPDGRRTGLPGTYSFAYVSASGCDSVHVVELDVRARHVYVPNVFKPESAGPNHVFTVYANESLAIVRRLTVYDRWGDLVFERRDLAPNDEQHGWDGRFRGRDLTSGVFVWMAELEFVDGEEALISGDVTVLR